MLSHIGWMSTTSAWQEHYEVKFIMQRNWATLAPKLAGKLHLNVGGMDIWYLNNA